MVEKDIDTLTDLDDLVQNHWSPFRGGSPFARHLKEEGGGRSGNEAPSGPLAQQKTAIEKSASSNSVLELCMNTSRVSGELVRTTVP